MVSSDTAHLILTVVGLATAVSMIIFGRMIIKQISFILSHLIKIYNQLLEIQSQQKKIYKNLDIISNVLEMRGARIDRIENEIFDRPTQEHEVVN